MHPQIAHKAVRFWIVQLVLERFERPYVAPSADRKERGDGQKRFDG